MHVWKLKTLFAERRRCLSCHCKYSTAGHGLRSSRHFRPFPLVQAKRPCAVLPAKVRSETEVRFKPSKMNVERKSHKRDVRWFPSNEFSCCSRLTILVVGLPKVFCLPHMKGRSLWDDTNRKMLHPLLLLIFKQNVIFDSQWSFTELILIFSWCCLVCVRVHVAGKTATAVLLVHQVY